VKPARILAAVRASLETGAVGIPKTRYARSGDVSIAYQVVGEGPPDLVYVDGYVSNVEPGWETLSARLGIGGSPASLG